MDDRQPQLLTFRALELNDVLEFENVNKWNINKKLHISYKNVRWFSLQYAYIEKK